MTTNIPVLVATKMSQGNRPSDFCHAGEGELITFSLACDRDNGDVDGPCGCQRSMSGLQSGRATTTFKVAILPDGETALREALTCYWQDGGWSRMMSPEEIKDTIESDLIELLSIAADFSVGSILEIRGDIIQKREPRK